MGSAMFRSDPLAAHEPQRLVAPEDEELVTTADRGSLAPQRGEGSRVRSEAAFALHGGGA